MWIEWNIWKKFHPSFLGKWGIPVAANRSSLSAPPTTSHRHHSAPPKFDFMTAYDRVSFDSSIEINQDIYFDPQQKRALVQASIPSLHRTFAYPKQKRLANTQK